MSATEVLKSVWMGNSALKAYYRMESGALTTDTSGNSNTLTNDNTVGSGTGQFGGGADFGASNTNKRLRLASALGLTHTSPFSMGGWFKLNAEIASGEWVLLEKMIAPTSASNFWISYQYNTGTRRILFRAQGSSANDFVYNITLGTSNWVHVVLTSDGTTTRGYVNGKYIGSASVPTTGSFVGYPTEFTIGGSNSQDNNSYASVLADDVFVIGQTLLADQIKDLYEGRAIGELFPLPAKYLSRVTELASTALLSDAGLKAYYKMESGALTTDSSGNGKTLTNNNSVAGVAGIFGGAADLGTGNTNKSLSIADNSGFGGATGSINFWLNTPTVTTAGDHPSFVFVTDGTAKAGIGATLGATGIRASRLKNGVAWEDTAQTAISANTWYMVTVTCDAVNISLYLNGVFKASVGVLGNGTTALPSNFTIGMVNGANYADGKIDDVSYFNRALTPNEVSLLAEQRGGLVGLWHLNGHSTDYSGNNLHGTDTAITYSQANGKFIQGAGFNGSSSKVILPNDSNLKPTTPFTISLWIKFTSSTAFQTYFASYSKNANVAGIFIDAGSAGTKARFIIGNNTGSTFVLGSTYQVVESTTAINDGKWHLVTAVWDGTAMKIYIDGKKDNETSSVMAPAYNATTYGRIGCVSETGTDISFFTGAIDEVIVFNRPLSAREIRQYYAQGVGKLQ